MKHFSSLQIEFVKKAMLFENMTSLQQEKYLADHPKSKKRLDQVGENVAEKLGIQYVDYWPDMKTFMFNDFVTETTFTARSLEEAEFRLKEKRDLWDRFRKQRENMVHAAIIDEQFIRLAKAKAVQRKKWFRMPLYRQQKYLDEHPESKKQLTGKQNFKRKHKELMRMPRKPRVRRFKNITTQRHLLNQKQHFTEG